MRMPAAVQDVLGNPVKRLLVALGLIVVGFLLWGSGGAKSVWYSAIAVPLVTALLLLDHFKPSFFERAPAWLRRPMIGRVAAGVYVFVSVVLGAWHLGGLLFMIGTALFVYDAHLRGELEPFDPTLLWRGWRRRAMFIAVVVAIFSLSANWLGDFSSYVSGAGYYYQSNISGGSSHELGHATIPALIILPILLWTAWRGPAFKWFRYIPLAVSALGCVYAIKEIIDDSRHVDFIVERGGVQTAAAGPYAYFLCMAVIAVVSAVYAFRRDPVAEFAQPAPA